MKRPEKYVVIEELPDDGFMMCIGIYGTPEEAYGQAYLCLIDGKDPEDYFVTLPELREGEMGYVFRSVSKNSGKTQEIVTVLFYDPKETDAVKGVV